MRWASLIGPNRLTLPGWLTTFTDLFAGGDIPGDGSRSLRIKLGGGVERRRGSRRSRRGPSSSTVLLVDIRAS